MLLNHNWDHNKANPGFRAQKNKGKGVEKTRCCAIFARSSFRAHQRCSCMRALQQRNWQAQEAIGTFRVTQHRGDGIARMGG